MRDEQGNMVPMERVKVEPDDEILTDEDGGTRFLKKVYTEFSAEGCRTFLKSLVDMGASALEEFDKAETDIQKLDITGSVAFALKQISEANMDTFRQWHNMLTEPELAKTINQEVKDLLGKDIDVESMSAEEIESLMREVAADAVAQDILKLTEDQEK